MLGKRKMKGELFLTVITVIAVVGTVGGLTIHMVRSTFGANEQIIRNCEENADTLTPAQIERCQKAMGDRGKFVQVAGQGMALVGTIPAGAANSSEAVAEGVYQGIQIAGEKAATYESCPAKSGQGQNTPFSATPGTPLQAAINCGNQGNPLPTDVTAPAIPGCTAGVFACSNGNTICRAKVCNGSNDCGDNSDEGSGLCGSANSCCQSTNGCPGETATSCASTCCCCPYGQICNRSNPAAGCISVGSSSAGLQGGLPANCPQRPPATEAPTQ